MVRFTQKNERTLGAGDKTTRTLSGAAVVGLDDDDDDGCDGVEVWRLLWWSKEGWKRRVAASGSGDRVDRAMRNTFGLGRKTPPEKFSGGGGGLPEFLREGESDVYLWRDYLRRSQQIKIDLKAALDRQKKEFSHLDKIDLSEVDMSCSKCPPMERSGTLWKKRN
ncbi:hypothetical protein Tco_1096474 [Tanacetum coccineum]